MKSNNSFQQLVSQPAPRTAISLIEVLISMGVLAVGLLSVAALFPVGGYYMRKGDISDRGSAIAQAAFSDIVARGVLDPDNWLAMGDQAQDPTNGVNFATADYRKPFMWRLRHTLQDLRAGLLPADIATQAQMMNSQFGSVFVIDPLGTAGFAETTTNSGTGPIRFPYNSNNLFFGLTAASPKWNPWKKTGTLARNHPNWPITRLTMGKNSTPMSLAVARTIFASLDDLVFEVPDNNNPATQSWDAFDNGTPTNLSDDISLSRQSEGNYSMLVTIAPSTQEARDSLAENPTAHSYSVSVVVFYKRVLGDVNSGAGLGNEFSNSESVVRARVMTKGLSGGELLLSNNVGINTESLEELKAGQWIAVFGPHPQSEDSRQMFFFQWYRVISVEGEDTNYDDFGNPINTTGGQARRVVSLRGPSWPWEADSLDASTSILSNDLRVGIFPGAVAVHSKTMRLEGNSMWSVD